MARPAAFLFRRFRAMADARRGTAAVEFALVVPVLAALLLGVFDLGQMAYDRTDLHGAVRSGAQYFMAGGDSPEAATALIEQSWTNRPPNSGVAVVRCCKCSEVDAPCGQLCPDGSVPDIIHQITATASFVGVFGEYEVEVEETVRAR